MLNLFFSLAIIYLFLLLSGVGIYLLLAPDFIKKPVLLPFLIPVSGLLQLSIISVYLIILNSNVTYSAYVSLFIGVISLYLAFRFNKVRLIADYLFEISTHWKRSIAFSLTICGVLVLILSPTINEFFLTTPYRIGIDQVGYSESAQFLFKGGTVRKVEQDLMHQLATNDIENAKNNNVKSMRFNTYVDSEFMLRALRWGYSAIVATMTYISGNDNVLRLSFLMLIINYSLTFVLLYFALFYCFNVPYIISFLASMAFALNCNILNIYYEGQSAQIFGMPILFLMQILYFHLRSIDYANSKEGIVDVIRGIDWKIVFFTAFLIAGCLSVYSELVFTFIIFIGFAFIFDLLLSRKIRLKSLLPMLIALFIGFIIVFPFSFKWVSFIIAHLKNIGIAGWWQPKWASPAEILGFFNIYADNPIMGVKLIPRTDTEFLLNLIISGLILSFPAVYFLKKGDSDNAYWLAAPIFIFMIFIKTRYIEDIHNYQYMKSYTLFLPIVFTLMIVSFHYCFDGGSRILKRAIVLVTCVFLIGIIISGSSYIRKYIEERGYITQDMFKLAKLDKTLDSYALITHKLSMDEYMLAPLISLNWLNIHFSGTTPIVRTHLSQKVAILVNKRDIKYADIITQKYADKVIYENGSFIILNTGHIVNDAYSEEIDSYDETYFLDFFPELQIYRVAR